MFAAVAARLHRSRRQRLPRKRQLHCKPWRPSHSRCSHSPSAVDSPVCFALRRLLIVLLFGGGFAWNVLWFIAAVFLVLWLIGFLARGAEARWYAGRGARPGRRFGRAGIRSGPRSGLRRESRAP